MTTDFSYHYVITIAWRSGQDFQYATHTGTIEASGKKVSKIYNTVYLKAARAEKLKYKPVVLYFDLQPEEIL